MSDDQYDAFISYNHGADSALASALRDGLHQFAKPWHRRRAMRVFLDRDSLEATSDLSEALEDKLHGARYLILLASNGSAASPWCDREASYWLEHRGHETLLLALTDAEGALIWDDQLERFDGAASTALPPSLVNAYPSEPLWTDLRWVNAERDPAQLNLRSERFRSAVATLASTIHAVPKDELDGEDVRQHERFNRIRRVVILALAMLTVVAIGAFIAAMIQRGIAEENERAAKVRSVEAFAAASLANQRLGSFASLDALVQAVRANDAYESIDDPPDGLEMQVADSLLGAIDGAYLGNVFAGLSTEVLTIAVAADADGVRIGGADGEGNVVIWDERGNVKSDFVIGGGAFHSVAFSPDLTRVAAIQEELGLNVYELDDSGMTNIAPADDADFTRRVEFGSDSLTLATLGSRLLAMPTWWDLDGRRIDLTSNPFTEEPGEGALDGPFGSVVSLIDDGSLQFQVGDVGISLDPGESVTAWAWTPDGRLVIGLRNGDVQLWDPSWRGATIRFDHFPMDDNAVSDDVLYLADGGGVSAWPLDGGPMTESAPWSGVAPGTTRVEVHSDGAVLAHLLREGLVRYWPDGVIVGDADYVLDDANLPEEVGRFAWSAQFDLEGVPLVVMMGADSRVVVLDADGVVRLRSEPIADEWSRVVVSPTGEVAFVQPFDGPSQLINSSEPLAALDVEFGRVVFSADGSRVATISMDGVANVWTSDGEMVAALDVGGESRAFAGASGALALSTDGGRLAVANGNTGLISLWDIDEQVVQRTYSTGAREWEQVRGLSFSPDGRRVAVTTERSSTVFSAEPLDVLGRRACSLIVNYLATSPDVREVDRGLCANSLPGT